VATVLSQVTLLDGTGADPVRDASIVFEGGVIRAVTAGAVADEWLGPEHRRHQLSGATVLPGLVDAHVHLVFSGGTDPRTDVLAASDGALELLALGNAQRALAAGITTLRDCGSRGLLVQRLRDQVNSGRLVGPTILAAGPPICAARGHLWFMQGSLATAGSPAELVRARAGEGVDLIKVMASGGHLTPGSNPREAEIPAAVLIEITETAHQLGLRVAAHAHGADAIAGCVDAGVDTIEHCSWLGDAEGFDYRPEVVDRMVARGVVISPAVPAYFRHGRAAHPAEQDYVTALVASRLRTTSLMRERGVGMIIGTDAGCPGLAFDSYAATMPVYTEGFGLSPMQALMAATSRGARALGLDDRLGSLVVGKQADLLVLDGDPLSDLSALGRVRQVYRGGRLVAENGVLTG